MGRKFLAAVNGTSITPEDAEAIVEEIRKVYDGVPPLFRSFIPPMSSILKRVPSTARKYRLEELIQLLEWAQKEGYFH